MPIHVRDNRGGNWFWMHNRIITEYGAQLGPYAIAVYAVLCCHADRDAQYTWVGQRAIADEIGTSRRQVQRELEKLRDLELLTIQEQQDEHGRTTNIYTLLALPLDSQAQGGVTQAQGPGLPVQAINKTHGTRLIEQENSNALDLPKKPPRRGRPPKATPFIEALITQFSAEFHDEEHTTSNVTRTMRLLKASGLPEPDFGTYLYQARGMAKSRGNIEKVAAGHAPLKNRMPYFFSVVEDLLGMRGGQDAPKSTTHGSLPKDTETSPSNGTADDQRVIYERFVQS